MKTAGMVLTGIGSAALLSGLAVIGAGVASTASYNAEGGGLLMLFVGFPLIGGSTMLAGVGIPLWVVGASRPHATTAGALPPSPRVAASLGVGPGSAALRFSF